MWDKDLFRPIGIIGPIAKITVRSRAVMGVRSATHVRPYCLGKVAALIRSVMGYLCTGVIPNNRKILSDSTAFNGQASTVKWLLAATLKK